MAGQTYPEFDHVRIAQPVLYDGLRKLIIELQQLQAQNVSLQNRIAALEAKQK
jgi:hypothetical protein